MITVDYLKMQKNFNNYFNEVKHNNEPLKVTSQDGNVVLIAEDEYNNMKENFFIFSNPAMVNRLNESVRQYENGETIELE